MAPSAPRPSTRTQPTDVDVSESPTTVSKICTSIAAQCPTPHLATMSVDGLARGRRKDRDSVVSSVYPGSPYACGARKCDPGICGWATAQGRPMLPGPAD